MTEWLNEWMHEWVHFISGILSPSKHKNTSHSPSYRSLPSTMTSNSLFSCSSLLLTIFSHQMRASAVQGLATQNYFVRVTFQSNWINRSSQWLWHWLYVAHARTSRLSHRVRIILIITVINWLTKTNDGTSQCHVSSLEHSELLRLRREARWWWRTCHTDKRITRQL